MTLGKIAEARGILEFWILGLFQRQRGLIEYK